MDAELLPIHLAQHAKQWGDMKQKVMDYLKAQKPNKQKQKQKHDDEVKAAKQISLKQQISFKSKKSSVALDEEAELALHEKQEKEKAEQEKRDQLERD